MPSPQSVILPKTWPHWVPEDVQNYLAHVEAGETLRALARRKGCHPSTILRQVRRLESRRDDPLIDAALRDLSKPPRACEVKSIAPPAPQTGIDATRLDAEALRVLRRMCESGAVLAVVPDMEKAVVVRETAAGTTQRTAVVDTDIARALALHDWIACKSPGRISRYAITPTGRTKLNELLADQQAGRPDGLSGMADAATPFEPAPGVLSKADTSGPRRVRYGLTETPLSALARRRERDGTPFLSPDLVAAGERLREDFELAQMGPRVAQNWNAYLTGPMGGGGDGGSEGAMASSDARARLKSALYELGPGLGDMALRCCCYLEGLETAERELGWAARSGKVVLRIALQRLHRHYSQSGGPRGGMIG